MTLAEWLKPVLFFLGYVVLMRWVLPRLGISTCMAGACRIPKADPERLATSEPAQDNTERLTEQRENR